MECEMLDADRDAGERRPMPRVVGPPVEGRADAGRRLLRRVPAPLRVALFTALLVGLAILLYLVFLRDQVPLEPPVVVPWYVMAAAFFAAELKVVDVHFRREKHSFSLSEFPAVIGFFLLSPGDYFMAMLLGTGAALLVHGQAPLKLAFNLSNFAFTAAAALSVFYLLQSTHGVPDPVDWIAAFAATTCAAVLSAFTIATAISMSGGAPQYEKLPEMIQFGGLVAIANTSLALLAVSVLWLDPLLLALLVVPLLTVFLAYRAYVSEREKHERLELLYQSSRILQHSPELDSALAALLEHAREMFRAERAEVLLWPRDETVDEGLLTVCEHDREPLMMVPRPLADADRLHRRVAHERRAVPPHLARPRRPRDPQRDGGAAARRGRADRVDGRREPADRGDDLLRRRPAAPRDARQPGGRRPRERPAGAVAGGAVAAQGAAPVPGLPRPADGPRQPQPVRRAGERRDRAPDRRPGPGRPVPRPRQLQGRQRRPGAPGRATGCSPRSPTASSRASAPATWPPASAATSSRSCCSTSRSSAPR